MLRILVSTTFLALAAGTAFAGEAQVPEPGGFGFVAAAVGALLAVRLLIRK
jgi:hypothetical protein